MENKIIIGVVSVFVAIVVLAGILMPVIDMATEPKQETGLLEGAYGPTLIYQDEPETVGSGSFDYMFAQNTNGVMSVGISGHDPVTFNLSELADKTIILYSDSYTTIYIEDGMYKSTTPLNSITETPITATAIAVTYKAMQSGVKYQISRDATSSYESVPSYYYVMGADGEYSNFAGDNPPTMDTPAVSVAGAYIGERYGTIEVDPFGANLYNLMPFLVIIAILVSAVVYFIGKSYL